MKEKKKIVAISGSTRKNSTNHRLIGLIGEMSGDRFDIMVYPDISSLPHFNPDRDGENAGREVLYFRQLLRDADGILICTPEYAHGVPGSLKNAIDWTVGSCEFSHKPTALITASTDGRFAHSALLETLRVIEAGDIDELQLLISFAAVKIQAGQVTDRQTLEEIQKLLDHFEQAMEKNAGIR